MNDDTPNDARFDRIETEASPSTGWEGVYYACGVASTLDCPTPDEEVVR